MAYKAVGRQVDRQGHEGGAVGPQQVALNIFTGVNLRERGPVDSHLFEINRRRVMSILGWLPIGFVIDDGDGLIGYDEAIDLAGNDGAFDLGDQRHFGEAVGGKQKCEIGMFDYLESLLGDFRLFFAGEGMAAFGKESLRSSGAPIRCELGEGLQ